MKAYLDIVEEVLTKGKHKSNRTGVNTIAVTGLTFVHEMSDGLPLLTTKKINFAMVTSELEFFIKGITDKKWLRDRNNHIWDSWKSKKRYHYYVNKDRLEEYYERELGPIYGWQWRHYGAEYYGFAKDYSGKGIDQLVNAINLLKKDPNSRRIYVLAWNPTQLDEMALAPCHYGFQLDVIGNQLDLLWQQRSADVAIGLPFNIASYATLLHLIAKETEFKEGKLEGQLGDVHIYLNHIDGLKKQLKREPLKLPEIVTENLTSVLDWEYTGSKVVNYNPHPFIKFEIAV